MFIKLQTIHGRQRNKRTNRNTANKLSNNPWFLGSNAKKVNITTLFTLNVSACLGGARSVYSKLLFSRREIFKINTTAYICFCSCNSLMRISIPFPIKNLKRQQIKHITYKTVRQWNLIKFKIVICVHLLTGIISSYPQYLPLEFSLYAEDSLELKIVSTFFKRDALNRCCGFHVTEMKL